MPKEKENFKISLHNKDGNELLRELGKHLYKLKNTHILLVYDPYNASIDWEAILPFLNTWGEVIINHQVLDSIRSIGIVKNPNKIKKYEGTYQASIEELIPYGTDRKAYEDRIEEIINLLHFNKKRKYYIAAYPFFNQKNSVVYNLIHCTSHIAGFTLYKQTAWQTFGDCSSGKNTHGKENQFVFGFDDDVSIKTVSDNDCYFVKDIAAYLYSIYHNRNDVSKDEMWKMLEQHPVFPTDGFKRKIEKALKDLYSISAHNGVFDFTDRR